jgi:hypothetical protein
MTTSGAHSDCVGLAFLGVVEQPVDPLQLDLTAHK